MSELEFVKELLALLGESDRRNIIKRASAKGFEVHGFSNKPYNAPKNIINSSLMRKNKNNISNYFLLLDVIDKFPLEQAEDKTLIAIAKKWINDDKSRIITEAELLLSYPDIHSGHASNRENTDGIDNSGTEGNSDDNEAQKGLEEKNILLQKKNKELKEKLKSSKIELDNLRKDLNICVKENKKQLAEIKRLQELSEEYSINQKLLREQIQESKSYSDSLLSQMEALSYYKDRALKVACFAKDSYELQIDGYNVTFFDEWSEQIKNSIDCHSYSEVWYVHEGFNYNCFIEIQSCFRCRIIEYMSIAKLMNGV